jgi:hypothetical protein
MKNETFMFPFYGHNREEKKCMHIAQTWTIMPMARQTPCFPQITKVENKLIHTIKLCSEVFCLFMNVIIKIHVFQISKNPMKSNGAAHNGGSCNTYMTQTEEPAVIYKYMILFLCAYPNIQYKNNAV